MLLYEHPHSTLHLVPPTTPFIRIITILMNIFSLSPSHSLIHHIRTLHCSNWQPQPPIAPERIHPAIHARRHVLRPPFQLNDESDFERILSPDGLLSVCGFSSLLSERSARSTFPDLVDFRVARLNGFRRVFAHTAPIFFERGIANPETKEISSLSVEPCEGETLIVTVFSIGKLEIPSFIEREHEFRFLAVLPETLDGKPFTIPAVLCARFSDEEYLQIRCKGTPYANLYLVVLAKWIRTKEHTRLFVSQDTCTKFHLNRLGKQESNLLLSVF